MRVFKNLKMTTVIAGGNEKQQLSYINDENE